MSTTARKVHAGQGEDDQQGSWRGELGLQERKVSRTFQAGNKTRWDSLRLILSVLKVYKMSLEAKLDGIFLIINWIIVDNSKLYLEVQLQFKKLWELISRDYFPLQQYSLLYCLVYYLANYFLPYLRWSLSKQCLQSMCDRLAQSTLPASQQVLIMLPGNQFKLCILYHTFVIRLKYHMQCGIIIIFLVWH